MPNAFFRSVVMSFVPLACIVLVAGCPMPPVAECMTDEDCEEGQVCNDGVCEEGTCPTEKTFHEIQITENLGEPNYQGTQNCLTCHASHGADIMESAHWNWSGVVKNIAGLDGEVHGKVDLINDY